MLTEFAFTPTVFDEEAHEDKEAWCDHLRELGRGMFPRTAVSSCIVSDLYGGSWNSIADQVVQNIKNQKARMLCKELLTKIRDTLVNRPCCGGWPNEDVEWCREAVASHRILDIDRIVAQQETKLLMAAEPQSIRSLDEVEDAGFWAGISADASPEMTISKQMDLLRKLCAHSDWVALINPHAKGNEAEFATELVRIATENPQEFAAVDFELHVSQPDVADPDELVKGINRVSKYISGEIQRKLAANAWSVDLYFWPKFLDRSVIAGTYTSDSAGQQLKRPRWGIAMSHVARVAEPSQERTEWKLLGRDALTRWFNKFVKEDAACNAERRTIPST